MSGSDLSESPQTEDDLSRGTSSKKPVITRPPAMLPRSRLPPGASEATRSVLSHFHGPVYALDRKPHLAQHNTVTRANSAPEKVAAAIFEDVVASLEHQAVKWNGLPAIQQWRRGMAPAGHFHVPLVAHVHLPRAFPQQNASVVWVGDTGIAGREFCLEFALTETEGGIITGFSYRYDLSGTPFIVAVVDAPEPDLNKPAVIQPQRGTAKSKSVSISVQAMPATDENLQAQTDLLEVVPLSAPTAPALSALLPVMEGTITKSWAVPAETLFGTSPGRFTW